jgi:hypothetical protein
LKIQYVSPAVWHKSTTKKKPRDFWYEGVVTSIVTKPVYMGIQDWGGQWYECPSIDAIFAKEEWDEANNIYQNKLNRKLPHKYFNTTFLFKDILFCAHCGERMIPTYKTSRYIKEDGSESIYEYYHYKCEGRWEKHNSCKQKKHNRKYVEKAIIWHVADDINGMNVEELYLEALKSAKEAARDYWVEIKNLENRIKELSDKIEQNVDDYQATKSEVIRRRLEKRVEEYEQELIQSEQQLKQLHNNPPKTDLEKDDVVQVYKLMQGWRGIMANPNVTNEEKRYLALSVLDKILLTSSGGLQIKYKVQKDFGMLVQSPDYGATISG